MKKALLIVNPHSGRKDGKQVAAVIRQKLASRDIESTVFISSRISDMEHFLERSSLNDFNFVGIVGGDGTMHSFLNAVLQRFDQVPLPVALFPCGTGNSFNFDIGCTSTDETLKSIFSNKTVNLDIAEVNAGNERLWSFNVTGCGLVAQINKLAEKMRWLGSTRYTIASLILLLRNRRSRLEITTEQGVLEGLYSFVLACNTRYTGKGMMMAPNAQLSDGKFDVIIVKACSAFTLLRLFPKIFKGRHINAKVLHYLQTNSLQVRSENLVLPAIIDGELRGKTPFSLIVHRNKLKVFVK